MADIGPVLRQDDKKNATSPPDREFQNPRSWKLCGSALPSLIEGGFLRLDDDRLAATASGSNTVLAALLA